MLVVAELQVTLAPPAAAWQAVRRTSQSARVRSMDQWFAKAVILLASIMMVAIRAPHGQRSRGVQVVRSRRGRLELILLAIAWFAFFLPLIWIVTPVLAFADYPLRLVPLVAGTVFLSVGAVALLHDSHTGPRHQLVDHS